MYIHSAGKKARSGKMGTGKKTVLQKKYEKVKQELATFMEHKKKCKALQEKGGRIPEDDSWNATPHICFRRSVISTCKTSFLIWECWSLSLPYQLSCSAQPSMCMCFGTACWTGFLPYKSAATVYAEAMRRAFFTYWWPVDSTKNERMMRRGEWGGGGWRKTAPARKLWVSQLRIFVVKLSRTIRYGLVTGHLYSTFSLQRES